MDKQRLEIAGAGILVIIFIFVWGGTIKKVFIRKAAPAEAPAPAAQIPFLMSTEIAPEAKKETRDIGWGRDPFTLHEVTARGADSIADLKLMGITISGDKKKMAIINNEIISAGSRIGKFRVLKIRPKSVVVTDGRENYTLKME